MDSISKILTLEQHLSQKELAKRLGVTPATIRNWKRQGNIPKTEQASKLNRVYGANKRHFQKDTISRAERKIREYDARYAFEVKSQRAAKQSRHIEDNYTKKKFIEAVGNKTAFYSGDGRRAQFMGAEPTAQGMQAGINGIVLHGVVQGFATYEDGSENPIYFYHIQYKIAMDIKSDLDLEQALRKAEDKFYNLHIPNTRKNQNRVPYQFLGYEVDYHRPKRNRKK